MSLSIVTWNVNSLRSCLTKGFSSWLTATAPDIVCLQEVRAELKHLLPLEPLFPGYRCFWNPAERPGYAGTAILTKFEPINVQGGLHADPDPQGRALTADYGSFRIMSLYAPNAVAGTEKIPIKVIWLARLREHILSRLDKPLFVCGDLNVAHTKWDSRGQEHPRGMNGCTPEEKSGFQNLLTDCHLIDPMRAQYDSSVLSTWWHALSPERHSLDGMRFDYILIPEGQRGLILDQKIQSDTFGSDHCPVSATVSIETSELQRVDVVGQTSLL